MRVQTGMQEDEEDLEAFVQDGRVNASAYCDCGPFPVLSHDYDTCVSPRFYTAKCQWVFPVVSQDNYTCDFLLFSVMK